MLDWYSRAGASGGQIGFSLLPPSGIGMVTRRIEEARARIADGSYTTLLFQAGELQQQLSGLRPYETCADLRMRLQKFAEQVDGTARGDDAYARQTGAVRRAFRSRLDGTLQPYCVVLPRDFDRSRRYPLMVYLHGSASTETEVIGLGVTNGGFIELGPLGRGRSNCFSTREAQVDIAEAIDDVIANYPVDTTRIVLSGFSMGGYGVYRTFYENPKRFRALAVFAGGPASDCPGIEGPDFMQKKYLKPFVNVPIFVYHGQADRNVPFARTAELVRRLKAAGARVDFRPDEGSGHGSAPGAATMAEYYRWLGSVVKGS